MKMRVIAGLVTLALMSPVVNAEVPKRTFKEQKELCDALSLLAKAAMAQRQAGKSIADVMRLADDQDEGVQRAVMTFSTAAWEQPRYQTKSAQDAAVTEFESQSYMGCMKAIADYK